MDVRTNIWNILHDGEITAISGEKSDTMTMFISIPYLRRRLNPLGDSIVLVLKNLKLATYFNPHGKAMKFQEEIEIAIPEIIQCKSNSLPLTVEFACGDTLTLDFETIDIFLDTGQPLEYEQLENICHEYWDEWKKKNEDARNNTSA